VLPREYGRHRQPPYVEEVRRGYGGPYCGVCGGVLGSSKQLCSEEKVETTCLVSVGRVTAGSTKSEKSMKNVYFYSGNKSRHSVKESRKVAVGVHLLHAIGVDVVDLRVAK
jgi:hypothetical protein